MQILSGEAWQSAAKYKSMTKAKHDMIKEA